MRRFVKFHSEDAPKEFGAKLCRWDSKGNEHGNCVRTLGRPPQRASRSGGEESAGRVFDYVHCSSVLLRIGVVKLSDPYGSAVVWVMRDVFDMAAAGVPDVVSGSFRPAGHQSHGFVTRGSAVLRLNDNSHFSPARSPVDEREISQGATALFEAGGASVLYLRAPERGG